MKHVKQWTESYRGAKIECMSSYIIPTKTANPDCIIIHAGTNDLPTSSTNHEIATSIVDLALQAKTKKNTVIISGMTVRHDKHGHGVDVVNRLVSDSCNSRNLTYR